MRPAPETLTINARAFFHTLWTLRETTICFTIKLNIKLLSEREIGSLIAEQPAPAPHLARPEGRAALRMVLVTVPRISRSCELVPDGFDLHLLQLAGPCERLCLLCNKVGWLFSCFPGLCRISGRGRDDISAFPAPSWTALRPCLAARKGRGSLLHVPSPRAIKAPDSRIPFPTAYRVPRS